MNIPPLSLGLSKGVERVKALDSELFSLGQAHGLLQKAGAHTPVHALSGRLQAGPNGGIELTVPASLIKGVFDALHEPGAEFVVRNNRTEAAIKVMTKAEVDKLGGQDKITERGHSYNYTLGPIVELPANGEYEKLWAISISSENLEDIRKSYGLETSPQLGFYIPVGIKKKNVTKENEVSKLAATTLPSQDEVYSQFLKNMGSDYNDKLVHVSGGLPDVRKTSDVDVGYVTPEYKNLLSKLPKGTSVNHKDGRSVYNVPGYVREVGLFATDNPSLVERSKKHRENELVLALKYPELAAKAVELKKGGMGTEEAWANVLGLKGDPYEVMLDLKP